MNIRYSLFKNIIALLVCLTLYTTLQAQKVYFADGYHGGVYGHYPLQWKTKFIVDKFYDHPEWKMNLEIEPETWDSVKKHTPEDYANLQKIITDKRIEITNPSYAQPYCYNISGESIIRQFEYGIRKTLEHFPDVQFTTYSVEEPCFTSCLPQILNDFGYKYAVLKCPNTCWGGYSNAYGGELVNWMGPDGSSILTVPRYEVEELEDNSTWQTKAWANSKEYLNACFDAGIQNPIGMCFQDAGWKNGPWLGVGDKIKNNSIYVTWKEYFEDISIQTTGDNWYFSQEDILVNLMWGSQVMQKLAREVRSAENNIVQAEKIAGMAHIHNYLPYEAAEFEEAWRTLMLAQHHDSWIVPYNGLNKHRTWAQEITLWTGNSNEIAQKSIERSLQAVHKLSTSASADGLSYVRVYNTQGVPRNESVSLELAGDILAKSFTIIDTKNKPIPYSVEQKKDGTSWVNFKAEVPSFGYATYKIQEGKNKIKKSPKLKHKKGNEFLFENDVYKVVFDLSKGGIIKSLVLKKEGKKEYVKGNSDYLLGELRGYFYDDEKFYSSTEQPAKLKVLQNNSIETKILIEGEIANHPFKQIITFVSGQKRIDFDLTIDWKHNVGIGEYKQGGNWSDNRRAFCDDRYKLSVFFPVDIEQAELYKNAPFDVCESKLDDTFFNSWDAIKHNVILNWVDIVDKDNKYGLSLMTDHTTSYSYGEGYPLALTVQYSGVGLWGRDYKITGPSHLKYALLPHTGKWDEAGIAQESTNWNEPLIASFVQQTAFENKSWIDVAETGYEISSVQVVDNALLLRLFNADGNQHQHQVKLNFPVNKVTEVDLNNDIKQIIQVDNTSAENSFAVSMPRFGIRTYLIR